MLRQLILAAATYSLLGGTATAAPPPTGVPAYDQAVVKGIAWLRNSLVDRPPRGGYRSLGAYALLKGGEPATSQAIQGAIDAVKRKIRDGEYTPSSTEHHIYEAGVDAMLVADADENAYRADVFAIVDYIVSQQGADGSWDYPNRTVGDTSMAQYALLGLWAGVRVGYDVPLQVWDKAAAWHIKTQHSSGGFMYHPGVSVSAGTGGAGPTLNMTAGATGTLAIAKLHLFPAGRRKKDDKKEDSRLFGVLEAKSDEPVKKTGTYRPLVTSGGIDAAIGRGLGWLTQRYLPISDLPHKLYYNYALERTCALNEVKQLGGKIDWFKTGGDTLLKLQDEDGSWPTFEGPKVGTPFAILFFIRPTKKTIVEQYGSGLLTGGRGLPEDLSKAEFDGGEIKERKMEGPLDELLSELSKINPDNFEAAQAAIVEKVQLGNREELLGQMDQIRKLINHSNPDARRTAVWALGRSGDLRDANLLISALQDNNVDVLVEAYNALCYLSRRITGVGLASNPLDDLPVNPSQAQIDAAVNRWRDEATKRWTAWYLRIRPYEEKNDLFQLQFGARGRK
ncbi:MAG: HEAT repeat domain-containing protein [Planctomycetota bacterium]|jgi:hypothetical protein